MTVVATGIADQARPGQFVAVAVGGDDGALLLRRAFSIHNVAQRGVYGVLPEVIERTRADVVYACGPMAMLEAVIRVAGESYGGAGIPTQVAVEESMACGVGVCMTCVLPVVGDDDVTRMVRSCVEGP